MINKRYQFLIYDNGLAPISLNTLSNEIKSKIIQIQTESSTGSSLRTWTPSSWQFSQLEPNKIYLVESTETGYDIPGLVSLSDYSCDVSNGDNPPVSKLYQFLCARSSFNLNQLSEEDKAKIYKVFSETASGNSLKTWTPSSWQFSQTVAGEIYLVSSVSANYIIPELVPPEYYCVATTTSTTSTPTTPPPTPPTTPPPTTPPPTPTTTPAPTPTPTPTPTTTSTSTTPQPFPDGVLNCGQTISGENNTLASTTTNCPNIPVETVLALDYVANTNGTLQITNAEGAIVSTNSMTVKFCMTDSSRQDHIDTNTKAAVLISIYSSSGTKLSGPTTIAEQYLGENTSAPELTPGSGLYVDWSFTLDEDSLLTGLTPSPGEQYYVLPEIQSSNCNGISFTRRVGDNDGDGSGCSEAPSSSNPAPCGMFVVSTLPFSDNLSLSNNSTDSGNNITLQKYSGSSPSSELNFSNAASALPADPNFEKRILVNFGVAPSGLVAVIKYDTRVYAGQSFVYIDSSGNRYNGIFTNPTQDYIMYCPTNGQSTPLDVTQISGYSCL